MSQTDHAEEKDASPQSVPPANTKLFLPDGPVPDVHTEDLILADVVHAIDGTKYILLLARPNLHFFIEATGPNLEALGKIGVPVNHSKQTLLKSAHLDDKLIELKRPRVSHASDVASEIVFDDDQQIVAVIGSESLYYFEYDMMAKNALNQQSVYIGLQLGGSSNPNDYSPD